MTTPKRIELAKFGKRGRLVRVVVERGLVRMLWYENGMARFESDPDTAKNRKGMILAAEAFSAELVTMATGAPRRITLRGLWDRFATAEFPGLRPRTRQLYREYFTKFELFAGSGSQVSAITAMTLSECRDAIAKAGLSISTQQHVMETVKLVFAWGVRSGVIPPGTTVLNYRFKVAKEERTEALPEYSRADWTGVLSQLDPRSPKQWRGYVALALCGLLGARQNSVLHLSWSDLDLTPGEERVRWLAKWDKGGKEWEQPLLTNALAVLAIAREWRDKLGYTGPYVLFGQRSREGIYTIQSLWCALQGAEKRAGVQKLPRRAGHGLRRLVAGDVAEITKDPTAAMHTIGDSDLSLSTKYIRPRDAAIRSALEQRETVLGPLPNLYPNRTGTENGTAPETEVVADAALALMGPPGFEPGSLGL